MENVRKRIKIVLVNKERGHAWQTSKPGFKRFSMFSEDLVGVELAHTSLTLDKPIYVGFSVLDLSKLLMFNFHYEVMKPLFPQSTLCFTDTDSFLYHIKTPDVYKDIGSIRDHFDFSNFPPSHPLYDTSKRAVIGKFKDEAEGKPIKEFIGLRSKCYSILVGDGKQKHTSAGVKTEVSKKLLKHEQYRKTLQGPSFIQRVGQFEDYYINQKTFRSYNHTLKTVNVKKVGLTRYDDKRWVCNDGISTRPYGHYLNQ